MLTPVSVCSFLCPAVLVSLSRTVGYHFHHDWAYMKQVVQGKVQPYLLHMNWNNRAETKVEFLEQLGEWHLTKSTPGCQQAQLQAASAAAGGGGAPAPPTVAAACCAVNPPRPVCHYRDKPSLIPCPHAPNLESGVSFW